jgi:1,4-dihydroxy-2-naphthoate octaprenyltransferase
MIPSSRGEYDEAQGVQSDSTLPYPPDADSASAPTEAVRTTLRGWLALTRPATLIYAAGPVVASLLLLWARGVHLLAAIAACSLIAAVLILAGANMLDEYLDYARFGARGGLVLREPQPRATALEESAVEPFAALRASLILLALGVAAGLPVLANGGPLILPLGIAGLAAAFLYSATSYALKRLPAGELVVVLALGPGVVVATVLAQHQRVTSADLLLGLAFGLSALSLLEVSHLRDAPSDLQMRRQTLVVVLGEGAGRALCATCFVLAFVLAVIVAFQPGVYHGAIAVLLAAPSAIVPLTGAIRAQSVRARQLVVGQTLRAAFSFAFWISLGFLVAGLVVRLFPLLRAYLGF